MKKDKEWLKQQTKILGELPASGNDYFQEGWFEAYESFNKLIDQLDEPNVSNETVNDILDANRKLSKRVKELGSELPVIPKFVADYLDGKEKWTAFELFYDIDELNIASEPISKWAYDNDNEENHKREIFLLSALRNGYTIKREKRYRLKSINKHLKNYSMAFNPLENSFRCTSDQYLILSKSQTVFTESELKEIDETGFERVEVTE